MKKQIKSMIKKILRYIFQTIFPNILKNRNRTWTRYTRDALQMAQVIDCSSKTLKQQQQYPDRIAPNIKDRICNWYLPQFDNPFYGGIMTILRLADYLHRTHGIRQRFLICGSAQKEIIKKNLVRAFNQLEHAEVIILDSSESIKNIPASDYSVATLWSTAYVLLGTENTGYKFYMIQDFEPAFYPAGSTYAQAELSYRFGFYGIANTVSIKEIYEKDYKGKAVVLNPNIDKAIFYPSAEKLPLKIKRIFYYARPGTPRNGFELASAALKKIKIKYGDSVDIVCAGADWNPETFGLKNVVRTIGLLEYAATANLYRTCHIGLVLMMTKHPSYLPFELMACGALVVTNYNEANKWLLKDKENCLLAQPSATCLAETLSFALDNYETLENIRKRATEDILKTAGNWDKSLSDVATFMLQPE